MSFFLKVIMLVVCVPIAVVLSASLLLCKVLAIFIETDLSPKAKYHIVTIIITTTSSRFFTLDPDKEGKKTAKSVWTFLL